MSPDQKAKFARVLGYTCVVVGAVNLTVVAVHVTRGESESLTALLTTGVVALMMGIFMVALGRRKPSAEE